MNIFWKRTLLRKIIKKKSWPFGAFFVSLGHQITNQKNQNMKAFNGIISIVLGLVALYLFIVSKTDQDVIIGFMTLLGSIIFILFMMMEERNEEISKLKEILFNKR